MTALQPALAATEPAARRSGAELIIHLLDPAIKLNASTSRHG